MTDFDVVEARGWIAEAERYGTKDSDKLELMHPVIIAGWAAVQTERTFVVVHCVMLRKTQAPSER